MRMCSHQILNFTLKRTMRQLMNDESFERPSIPDNSVDHCPANIRRRFDNNYYSYFDIEAIGSCTDHQHSSHRRCSSDAANANGFVVNNYRRRHYLMRMPTHDVVLKFLVANIDASVDCWLAVMADFPSQLHYEPALVLVVCPTYRVDLVMLSGGAKRKEKKSWHMNSMIKLNLQLFNREWTTHPCFTSMSNETLRARSFVDPLSGFR